MRNTPRPALNRLFSIPMLVIASIIGFAEAGESAYASKPASVRAPSFMNGEVFSENGSISTYQWNLNDEGLPLISLPDPLREGLDLSLTYSMGQFQFPLFQSLYFNERVGKYILMVIPKQGRRAQFIDLDPGQVRGQFEARGQSRLFLKEKGIFKLLSKRQPFRRLRVLSANVLPEYQNWGIGLVLLKGLVPKLLSSGIEEIEFSWIGVRKLVAV